MVEKNSFASDFMTNAIRNFPVFAFRAGAVAAEDAALSKDVAPSEADEISVAGFRPSSSAPPHPQIAVNRIVEHIKLCDRRLRKLDLPANRCS